MPQPAVIRACEIVPLKMLWSECAYVCVVCVVRLCCLSLEYLEMRGSLVILWHSFTPSSVLFPPLQLLYF